MKISGDIKVVEKMETEETHMEQNSLEFKMSEKVPNIASKAEEKSLSQDQLVAISTTSEADDKNRNKNVITILPDGSELLDGDTGALINMDHINDVGELDEDGLLHVKQELCEIEPEAVYSCTSCDMSFNSVVEHIKQFHDGQEVLLEIADQLDDIPTVPATNTLTSESGNVINNRQRQSMNTLRTEECVDSEGRLYKKSSTNRKILG